MNFKKLLILPTLLLVVTFSFLLCSRPSSEQSTIFVDDKYGLFTKKEEKIITEYNKSLLRDYDIQIFVEILNQSPEDINEFAAIEFSYYLLGNLTRGAKGVLFIIDPISKVVRVEVGYDLEAFYTDVFISYIEREQMAPFFEANKIAIGLLASIEMLVIRANEFYNDKPFSDITTTIKNDFKGDYLSGGAGAKTEIDIGAGKRKAKRIKNPQRYSAQPTPMLAFLKRIELLQKRNHDHDLGIYTPESREFFKNWITTDAQCYNELCDLAKAKSKPVFIIQDSLAVIRWALIDKKCAPSFFRKDSTGWMFDIAAMNKNLAFDTRNDWLMSNFDHDYLFAFKDICFDYNGHPSEKTTVYKDCWIPDLIGIPPILYFSSCKTLSNTEVAKTYSDSKKMQRWIKKVGRKTGYYNCYIHRKGCKIEKGIYSIYSGTVIYKDRTGAKEAFTYFRNVKKNATYVNVGSDGYYVFWDTKSHCDASKKVRHIRLDFIRNGINGYITVTIIPGTFNDNKLVSLALDLATELDKKLVDKINK